MALLGVYLASNIGAALLAAKSRGWSCLSIPSGGVLLLPLWLRIGSLRGIADSIVSNGKRNEKFTETDSPFRKGPEPGWQISIEEKEMINRVLGIHDGNNAAAALVEGGKVVAAVQEERLTGIKNQGGLPREAIGDVLSAGSATLSQIEKLALNGNYMTYDHWDREGLLAYVRMIGGGLVTRFKATVEVHVCR